jgi:hypothetical protein
VQVLKETLEKEPQVLGYDFSIWSIERLRLHLEKERRFLAHLCGRNDGDAGPAKVA